MWLRDEQGRWRYGRIALIAVLVVVVILIGWLYLSWTGEPAYWRQNERFLRQSDPERLDNLAEELENAAVREVTAADPDVDPLEPRNLRLRFTRINAWLDRRLDDWLAHREIERPEGLGRMMVTAEAGQPVLAFEYAAGEGEGRVYSATLDVDMNEAGRARAALVEVRAGTLPLPTDQVLEMVEQQLRETDFGAATVDQAMAVLRGDERFEPRWRLDERAMRITNAQIDDTAVELTLRHELAAEQSGD